MYLKAFKRRKTDPETNYFCMCRSDIMWYFNDAEIGKGRDRKFRHKKLTVSRKGVLRIKDIRQEEAGQYSCTGNLKFTVSRKGVLRIKDISQEEAGQYSCTGYLKLTV